jgi:hypothetical protein
VQTLPVTDIDDTAIYLVPIQDPQTSDNYAEYIYINNQWEKLGETPIEVDLDNYYTKDETYNKNEIDSSFNNYYTKSNTYNKTEIDTALSGKGTYSKPTNGIPKTDLASDVQTSLGLADSAIQTHQDISGKEDKNNKVTSITSSSTDTQYPSAKCVYDIVGDISSALDSINGEVI